MVVVQWNASGLIRYVFFGGGGGGGGRITYYHSALKESIRLQKGVFYLFNIMFELWTSSDVGLDSGTKSVDRIQRC